MLKNYQNYRALAVEIMRGKWLLHQPDAVLPAARDFLAGKAVIGKIDEGKPALLMAGPDCQVFEAENAGNEIPPEASRVLIIPVHGVLTKYDNCFGCSTQEVADILARYREDDTVGGFILDIDSPGGSANAVMLLIGEIRRTRESGKPVIAHVDQCCSAAYWIASQCDAIYADNSLSELGSIGAYVELIDDRVNALTGEKHISIYAPQSTEKNKAYREALEGKPEAMEAELSELVSTFQDDVKAARPDLKADADGVLSGAVFRAEKAVELGLANGMADLYDCIELVFAQIE